MAFWVDLANIPEAGWRTFNIPRGVDPKQCKSTRTVGVLTHNLAWLSSHLVLTVNSPSFSFILSLSALSQRRKDLRQSPTDSPQGREDRLETFREALSRDPALGSPSDLREQSPGPSSAVNRTKVEINTLNCHSRREGHLPKGHSLTPGEKG